MAASETKCSLRAQHPARSVASDLVVRTSMSGPTRSPRRRARTGGSPRERLFDGDQMTLSRPIVPTACGTAGHFSLGSVPEQTVRGSAPESEQLPGDRVPVPIIPGIRGTSSSRRYSWGSPLGVPSGRSDGSQSSRAGGVHLYHACCCTSGARIFRPSSAFLQAPEARGSRPWTTTNCR